MEKVNSFIAFIEKMSPIFAPMAYIFALLATASVTIAFLSQKREQFKFARKCFYIFAIVAVIFYIFSKIIQT